MTKIGITVFFFHPVGTFILCKILAKNRTYCASYLINRVYVYCVLLIFDDSQCFMARAECNIKGFFVDTT